MKQFSIAIYLVGALAASAFAQPPRSRPLAKPVAPVELRLEARAIAGGYEVTLTARPTLATPSVELRLGDRRATFAATRAGEPRTLTARIAVAPDSGTDVTGSAAVAGTGSLRTRATMLRLGTPAPQPTTPTVTRTIAGHVVTEVR